MKLITAHELVPFLLSNATPILDVRAPAEYLQGHVPGAISFPLFSDEERAVVGTLYKQQGKSQAFLEGLRIVGPKMASFVEEAIRIAPERKLIIHCWRGGQRSKSMAWLLHTAGFEVTLLVGGYKAFRKYVQHYLDQTPFKLLVLGGNTGSGKTKVLESLKSLGQQVIDLEALANHKGSAFGHLGEQVQPRTEHFENLLFAQFLRLDLQQPIWVENESRGIGSVYLPSGLWQSMRTSLLYTIEIPIGCRIKNLINDYAKYPKEDLKAAFRKIGNKLGGLELKNALEALDNDSFEIAAAIALKYYDKNYQYSQQESSAQHIHRLVCQEENPNTIALQLIHTPS